MPLDGDMSNVIVPSPEFQIVLDDPLGLQVILEKKSYAAPNRFFAHWFMFKYFNTVPILLQNFTDPISSVYLSCTLIKTLVEVSLILIISLIITTTLNCGKYFLLTINIISPLFQTYGAYESIGIIDRSITYLFFYGLFISILLIYFFPFYKYLFINKRKELPLAFHFLLVPLSFVLAFGGPLVTGIILVSCPTLFIIHFYNYFIQTKNKVFIKRITNSINSSSISLFFHFCFISALCLYSLYIGQYNIENETNNLSLIERYKLLPIGFIQLLKYSWGISILVLLIIINIVIIYYSKSFEYRSRILNIILFLLIVNLFYILLLPLGGYRIYRPLIIRYDTIIPLSISYFIIYGTTSIYLIYNINKYLPVYITSIILFTIFMITIDLRISKLNECERNSLEIISASNQSVIELDQSCNVMAWGPVPIPEYSIRNATLLRRWNIIKQEKMYYNKQ
jgi:hypothetical protein